ncbi:MAG: hypothetical protein ABIO83_04475 [Ilumatobacteraceae bacterium]
MFDEMAVRDGVLTCEHARTLGLVWEREQTLVDAGVIDRPVPGVIRAIGSEPTWRQRVRIAALAPGDGVISHGAAARLHALDGFDRYDEVDVLCRKGWWPNGPDRTLTHFTRGLTHPLDVIEIGGIRTLSIGATLTLLSPTAGLGGTARALDSALRAGATIDDLRLVGQRWTKRGRPGPRTLLMLLDERDGKTLPASWFQRLAKRMLEMHALELIDEFPVRRRDGTLLARLDLAAPNLRIGIECQSWRWHATPEAQHRDARRRGALRGLGWEIVDVWWRDLEQPDRIERELTHLIGTRTHELSAGNRWWDGTGQTGGGGAGGGGA